MESIMLKRENINYLRIVAIFVIIHFSGTPTLINIQTEIMICVGSEKINGWIWFVCVWNSVINIIFTYSYLLLIARSFCCIGNEWKLIFCMVQYHLGWQIWKKFKKIQICFAVLPRITGREMQDYNYVWKIIVAAFANTIIYYATRTQIIFIFYQNINGLKWNTYWGRKKKSNFNYNRVWDVLLVITTY